MTNPVLAGAHDSTQATILLVHHDDGERELLGYWLLEEGFRVFSASSPADALELFRHNPDVLVLLNPRHEETGRDFLPQLQRINPSVRCCLIGPQDARFVHCFPKPLPLLDMIPVLRELAGVPPASL